MAKIVQQNGTDELADISYLNYKVSTHIMDINVNNQRFVSATAKNMR